MSSCRAEDWLSVQSIDFHERSIHKTCEFTSSNNFINNVIGADNTVKFAVCPTTTADFEQAIE